MMPTLQTVVASNYLPLALVLARSARNILPQSRLCILLTDVSRNRLTDFQRHFGELADFICCDDLPYDWLNTLRRQYDVLEFNSACKALALHYQLQVRGVAECYFLDPDMLVTGDFTLPTQAQGSDLLVTQHALKPFPDDRQLPCEQEIVIAGSINGGFIYARNSAASQPAVDWLVQHTRYNWFVAPAYGMYGDQHWLSFLPQFFAPAAGILRDPGVNIAYWNLHERPLQKTADGYTVAGHPARLFHFSGFAVDGAGLTRHSQRRFDAGTESLLPELVGDYRRQVQAARSELQGYGCQADLAFSRLPLRRRMLEAAQHWQIQHPLVAPPISRFARLGNYLDRLLGN